MAEATNAPEASGRRTGLRLLFVAVVLLLLLVGVLAATRPDLGSYPTWVQIVVHACWLAATGCFARGSFLVVVGTPSGTFASLRTPVGLLVGLGSALAFAAGAFLLHVTLGADRKPEDAEHRHRDWDWD